MSFITIFTAPKPFTNPHIALIQRNAIRSWLALGLEVEVLVIGDEPGIAENCAEMGAPHLPDVERNEQGTPLISSIFELARQHSTSPILAYVNADVILLPDAIAASRSVSEQARSFLIVGQRWDLAVTESLEYRPGWETRLRERVAREGRLHQRGGSDYFIYRREDFTHMPAFAVGRAGWDNWMIYDARYRGAAVVDATAAIQVIHQDHDYSHLPGGQPHYRLPETFENVRLAGGRLTIFKLDDANRRLTPEGKLVAMPFSWRKVETFPLVTLHSKPLAYAVDAVFHPKKAYGEWRKQMKKQPPGAQNAQREGK
jgi:hypothetical protein